MLAVMTRQTFMLLFLVLVPGRIEPAPNWLYQGISVEFGVDEHLGAYHWYSEARFEAEGPCRVSNRNPFACAAVDGVYSSVLAQDHEIAHMGHLALASPCPSVFEEGLAVYYSTSGATPSSGAIELLAQRFQALDERLPAAEYYIAGRFVGMLVRRFGLDAVLEVCEVNGAHRDPESFASAMISVLGASPGELVNDLANETGCHRWDEYQSRVLACGEASAARSAGVVDEKLLLRYRMGCDEETTVGPRNGSVRIVERIEFLHSGSHLVSMFDANKTLWGDPVPPVELILAPCVPCDMHWSFMPSDAVGPISVDAGTYWLEMRANEDFSGEFTLEFSRD
jgi:hypothetical protein